jgi:hypothetical protein
MYRDCTLSDLNVTANPHAGWPRAVYRIVGSYPLGLGLRKLSALDVLGTVT